MQTATQFWDKTADRYAKMPIRDVEAYEYTLERTRSYLAKTDRVLELGCGTGSTALLLAGSVAGITASDISPKMIEIARDKAEKQGVANARFLAAGVFDEALDDGPYDAVLAFNLIHLIDDTDAAMRRIEALLKPGGTFISKTPCLRESGMPMKYRVMMLALPLMQMFGKAPYVRLMSIGDLEGAVTRQGFKIIETGNYPASPASRYIVARKPRD